MHYEDNFFTYLKWRGDLSIKEHPFNEVDAFILSELAYIRFENIVPGVEEDGCITIREANAKYEKSTEREMPFYKEKEDLFDVLAFSPRFADMTLCKYVSTLDREAHEQFAAMHVNVSPNFTFIAFRGTDSTVVGWREDLNMSFMMPVPAQRSAVEYVEKTGKGLFKKYCFGGHSKGGNLAVYSAVFCNQKLQKRIVKVYNFDGPGFNRKMIDDEAYKRVENRIETFVPEQSIVGLLMEHEEDYKVVESTEFAILQHEGFSWVIDCNQFALVDEVNKYSKSFSLTLKTWLEEMTPAERKEVVDAFFNVFVNAGINDFMEIADMDVKTAGRLLKEVAKVPHALREKVMKLVKLLIEENSRK
ncbi:MAG: DUF2974 domain-containing protein [Agathobacter sp.]|nr:DUF2974 domain-containing protein [Agathobacter sp.]